MMDIRTQFFSDMDMCMGHIQTNTLVLGISGGVDSMVLAHLMHTWACDKDISIHAVIVDHRLRNNSTDEAVLVQSRLHHMGIGATIYTNSTKIPDTGIQQYARQVRYGLLHQARNNMHAGAIVVAHHYNDCLETVAIRKNQGSTPYGMSAMNMVHVSPQGVVCRPLLRASKHSILEYAKTHDILYVDDPSNQNLDFTRVQVREKIAKDETYKLYLENLYQDCIRFRQDVDTHITHFIHQHARPMYGTIRVDTQAFMDMDTVYQMYTLRHMLMWVSGHHIPPRTAKIDTVLRAIQERKPATLHGCYIRILQKSLWIWSEPYTIYAGLRFEGATHLYGDCDCKVVDKTGDAFAQIPKLVQKTLPVRVVDREIHPLKDDKLQKYDKNIILFIPPPFILSKNPLY